MLLRGKAENTNNNLRDAFELRDLAMCPSLLITPQKEKEKEVCERDLAMCPSLLIPPQKEKEKEVCEPDFIISASPLHPSLESVFTLSHRDVPKLEASAGVGSSGREEEEDA